MWHRRHADLLPKVGNELGGIAQADALIPRRLRFEVPVFWACGVTPQVVAVAAKIPFMITHKVGHMFVSDLTIDQILHA